jgi:hypothetical protein
VTRRSGVMLVCAAGLVALTAWWSGANAPFFRSWLFAFLFAQNISLGSLALLMVHALTGGEWGRAVRPALVAAARLMPFHALLFIPLLPGLPQLYPWWPGFEAAVPAEAGKALWLDSGFFLGRAAAYFALWIPLAWYVTRLAARNDAASAAALRRTSAWGLLIYVFTSWLAGVDWIMSLAPRWYSSGFGFVLMCAQALAALAFGIVSIARDSRRGRAPPPDSQTSNDLGNLLLTCAMLWMYVAFTQFLIIWAEDLPAEIVWYLPRVQTSWVGLTGAIVLLQFVVPFALLLSRPFKRSLPRLGAVAGLLLAAHALYVFYLIVPTLAPSGFTMRWTDVSVLAGIALACVACWANLRRSRVEHA